jgi:O-methyltransferase involved in polyketide biosynthesis
MDKLGGVPDTLFIPLVARIVASKKFPEYFFDKKALLLEKYIPNNTIQKNSSKYWLIASVARSYNLDLMVEAFIAKQPNSNIVYLGAGLETAYYRLKTKSAEFYEVDLPEVILARRRILGEQPNDHLIASDMFDIKWTKLIDKSKPTLLIVAGVFQYFEEPQVVKFIVNLKKVLPSAELIFDATNQTGIKRANKYVAKTGNTEAPMSFYVNDGLEFAKKIKSELIEQRVFFTVASKILSQKLDLYTRIAMKVVDAKKRAVLLHFKIS